MDTTVQQANWMSPFFAWLGGLATFYIGQTLVKQNTRKVLTWDYAVGALADVNGTFSSDVEIFFNKKKIEDARALSITVRNTGPTHVEESDFKEDMKLSLPGSEAILQIRVSVASAKIVQPNVWTKPDNSEPAAVYIKPLLLNPGEQFTLFTLVSGYKNEVKLIARVAGGSLTQKIPGVIEFEPINAVVKAVFTFALLCGLEMLVSYEFHVPHPTVNGYIITGVVSAIAGFALEVRSARRR